jgi:beta-N-acetylhexosaminidase
VIRSEEHLALANRVSEQAVTLVKDDAKLLPLQPEQSVALIYPNFEVDLPVIFADFASTLITIPTAIDPDAAELNRIVMLAEEADVAVVATANANFYPGQIALVEALQAKPLAVIAMTSPYDLLAFPQQPVYLTTYNNNASLLLAAVKLLYGQIEPVGALPVELPPYFPVGHRAGAP